MCDSLTAHKHRRYPEFSDDVCSEKNPAPGVLVTLVSPPFSCAAVAPKECYSESMKPGVSRLPPTSDVAFPRSALWFRFLQEKIEEEEICWFDFRAVSGLQLFLLCCGNPPALSSSDRSVQTKLPSAPA